MRRSSRGLTLAAALVMGAAPARAQVLDLTVNDVGVAIGDKPRMTGLRLNFRDARLEEITGVNVTIWMPYEPANGLVRGLALGLPSTGAGRVQGVLVAPLGGGTTGALDGIGIGGVGLGGGGPLRGIMIGGVGLGSGGGISGVALAGVGVGSGGAMRGLMVGGIGVGGQGAISGISIGGIGVGSGGSVSGLTLAGVGIGSGGTLEGITIAGIGAGAAGGVTGLTIGGIGVGSAGTVRGLTIAGVGVGAPRLEGVAISPIGAGALRAQGIMIAGAYFAVGDDRHEGRFDGGSLSAFNRIRGEQHGVSIGLLNYARTLDGWQIGLLNISDNDGHRRVLPIVSVR